MSKKADQPSGGGTTPQATGTINRTLRILTVLCEQGTQTLADISEQLGLTPSTTLRFLRIMQDEGFAYQDENRRWQPTLATWRLGCAVVDGTGWNEAMDASLNRASSEINETVIYAMHEAGYVVYVATSEPNREVRTHVPLGSRHPLPDTLTGRTVLAFMDADEVDDIMGMHWGGRWKGKAKAQLLEELATINERGFEVGAGRRWEGLWAAAVPVFGRLGEAVGSIACVVPLGRQPDDPERVLEPLRAAARSISP